MEKLKLTLIKLMLKIKLKFFSVFSLAFFVFSFFSASSFALTNEEIISRIQKNILRIESGRVVYYETLFNSFESPTIILLPGINRGISIKSDIVFAKSLFELGYNILAPTFSVQGESIKNLAKDEPAFFLKKSVSSADLAAEIVALNDSLQLKNSIVASLSYSVSITPFLPKEKFPVIIDIVPLGESTETVPGAPIFNSWKELMKLNPWGALWMRFFLDQNYYAYWSYIYNGLKSERKAEIIQGSIELSRAAEEFDLEKIDYSKGPLHHFILAGKDDDTRLIYQKRAYKLANQVTQGRSLMVLISESGHIAPLDQPVALSNSIHSILIQYLQQKSNIYGIWKASEGRVLWQSL